MRPLRCVLEGAFAVTAALTAAQAALASSTALAPAPVPTAPEARPRPVPLQLEVWLNGASTGLIGEVVQVGESRFLIRASELKSLGLQPPAGTPVGHDPELQLDALPGVRVRYNAHAQRLDITADDAALVPLVLRGREAPPKLERPAAADLGALVNYSLVTGAGQAARGETWTTQGLGGAFDVRLFGPFGLLSAGFTAQASAGYARATRLDTSWGWSDPTSLATVNAGDLISGGFVWTRPVRLGGLQLRRDFALRPDLITMPSPQLSASAAVPSLADVLVNGVAVDSEAVKSGPLQIQDLPVVDGANRTTLVLRDTLGRQTTYNSSFFVTPDLLRPGLMDFSFEAGFPRRRYGERSFDYQGDPSASASVRGGVTDWLSLDAHGEADTHLINGGGSVVARVGGMGVVSASMAASEYRGQAAGQAGGTVRAQLGPVTLNGVAQQSFGAYYDLGAVSLGVDPRLAAPPRQLIEAGVSAPLRALVGRDASRAGPYLALDISSVSPVVGRSRTVANADVRQTFAGGLAVFLNAYADVRSNSAGLGAFFGVSMPFGSGGTADVGVQNGEGHTSAFAEASHQGGLQPGALSWRMRAAGGDGSSDLQGEAAYRTSFAVADVRAERLNGTGEVQATLDGSLVLMDGQVFAANRIDGAFAVVDTGQAHVPVTFENRPVGVTDLRGRLLIPYLTAYERNAIGIDGDALPADLVARNTRQIASPARGAGVVVRFSLRPALQGALVAIHDASGAPLPVGAQGRIASTGGVFVIGYDGLAYLEAVSPGAPIQVRFSDGHSCSTTAPGTMRPHQTLRCL